MKLTNSQKNEIISLVMKDVDAKTFDLGLSKGSFQFLYEKHKNHLVHSYFQGSILKWSIAMVETFEPYNNCSLELKELNEYLIKLRGQIKRAKSYSSDYERIKKMIIEYNENLKIFNQKSKPIRTLINKHYKLNKNDIRIN